jgi:hypothetical protein
MSTARITRESLRTLRSGTSRHGLARAALACPAFFFAFYFQPARAASPTIQSTPVQTAAPQPTPRPLCPPAPLDFVCFREIRGLRDITPLYWSRTPSPTPTPSPSGPGGSDSDRSIASRSPDSDIAARPMPYGHLYADLDSTIRIQFDRAALAQKELQSTDGELFATGRLSLQARIGERAVEVQGYSELGKGQVPVGPPGDVSPLHFLLNLQYLQYAIARFVTKDANPVLSPSQPSPLSSRLDARKELGKKAIAQLTLLTDILDLITRDPDTATAFFKVSYASPAFVKDALNQLHAIVCKPPPQQTPGAATASPQADPAQKLLDARKAYLDAGVVTDRVLRELDKAKREADAAQKAFAAETDATKRPALEAIANKTAANQDTAYDNYHKQQVQELLLRHAMDGAAEESNDADKAIDVLVRLNTVLNRDVMGWARTEDITPDLISDYWKDIPSGSTQTRATQAFLEVYRKLVDGQIVPSRIGAKPGDTIIIDVLVYADGQARNQDSACKPAAVVAVDPLAAKFVAFTVAAIEVYHFGLHVGVTDSFLLIKRIHEADPSDPNAVENNFRPAPGASLLWSNIHRPEEPGSWLSRSVAPSLGLNVSFLNFNKTKTYELGVGPIVGLFRDQVQLGAGVNLNGDGSLHDRLYAFIGLSFARLAEKLAGPQHIGALGEKPAP